MRGLFNVFSRGIDELAGKLQAQGFSSVVDNHDGIKLAERLHGAGIQVDLLMPVDAVSPSAVPANVRRVVNYFQASNGCGQPVRPGASPIGCG